MNKKNSMFICCLALLTASESNSAPETEWGIPVPLTVQNLNLAGEVVTNPNGYTSPYNSIYPYSSARGGGWSGINELKYLSL